MAKAIKSAVYDKSMKIEGAIEYLNKTYRRFPPRCLRMCNNKKDALALLDEVQEVLDDAHLIARIEAVKGWIENME
ncbi:hypothetical protein [uncultured Duncaniella sp.]|uniref:hypothetical protein n=1 Tax=uncultured Duncaniella sp. TaxID=2768039 RepID=UPI00261993B7|nr:hypothetical protein [uncultured Duncaniella sp.]